MAFLSGLYDTPDLWIFRNRELSVPRDLHPDWASAKRAAQRCGSPAAERARERKREAEAQRRPSAKRGRVQPVLGALCLLLPDFFATNEDSFRN